MDVEELCASARFCHLVGDFGVLFSRQQRQLTKVLIEEVFNCPSGRLLVQDKETRESVEAHFEKSIGLIEDPWIGVKGSMWVRG